MEWVDVEHRKLVGVCDSLSWTTWNVVFAAIAYFVNDWRWLIISISLPITLAIATWRYVYPVPTCSTHAGFDLLEEKRSLPNT